MRKINVRERRLVISALGIASSAALLTGLVMSAAASESKVDEVNDEQPSTELSAATSPLTSNWITEESPASRDFNVGELSDEQTVIKPLASEPSGPLVETALSLVPLLGLSAGSVLSTNEYPSIPGGNVVFLDGELTYSVAIQQMSEPVSLDAITMGKGGAALETLPSGSQTVSVDRSFPYISQAVLVRPGGMMITLTVTKDPASAKSSIETVLPPEVAPAKLADLLTGAVDGAVLDMAANPQ